MYKKRRFKGASSRITRRSKVRHFLNVFLRFSVPFFIFLSVVMFLRADFIQLKTIEISGNKDIKTEAIEKLALASLQGQYFWIIPKSNMLFFDESTLVQKIREEFTRAERVEVSKGVKGSLKVSIKEREGGFVWCSSAESCFLMSRDGLVFVPATLEEIQAKIIFRGNILGDPIMQNFASAEKMQNYLKAIQILSEAGFNTLSINVELQNKAVFKTEAGKIFLNPEEDLSLSVPNAIILINEIRSKNPSATFEYIDARFGNKVFYK